MPVSRWKLLEPSHFSETARLSEAHHRIANNLALVAAYVRLKGADIMKAGESLTAAEVRALLDSVSARIETVARLNRAVAQDPERGRIDIAEFLEATCAGLAESV